jgi:hypothetical protein
MLRIVLFLLGCALMVAAIVADALRPVQPPTVPIALFRVGLLLTIGAHGWPEGLR